MQPIELQNMYSQLSNVSKAMPAQQQAVQLAQSLQQQTEGQKVQENLSKVEELSNEQSKSALVNEDGHNSGQAPSQGQNKKNPQKDENSPSELLRKASTRPSYLGNIIDITR